MSPEHITGKGIFDAKTSIIQEEGEESPARLNQILIEGNFFKQPSRSHAQTANNSNRKNKVL